RPAPPGPGSGSALAGHSGSLATAVTAGQWGATLRAPAKTRLRRRDFRIAASADPDGDDDVSGPHGRVSGVARCVWRLAVRADPPLLFLRCPRVVLYHPCHDGRVDRVQTPGTLHDSRRLT